MVNLTPIPGFPNYVVSTHGHVKNLVTNHYLRGSIGNSGYRSYRVKNKQGVYYTLGAHRAVALAYIPDERNRDELYVNHIDGDKLNNYVGNLEWVTESENMEHAGELGLTSKCVPVQTFNSRTGEIKTFPSILSCSKYVGISKDQVANRIGIGCCKTTYPEGFRYRRKSKSEWNVPVIPEQQFFDYVAKSVKVRNVLTGEVTIYRSQTDAANNLCLSSGMISIRLKSKSQAVLPGFVQIKRGTDNTPWRDVTNPFLELAETMSIKMILAELDDGSNVLYYNAKDAAKEFDIPVSSLRYRIDYSKDGYGTLPGVKLSYYDGSVPWETLELCAS